MTVVTTDPGRGQSRDVYDPPGERGMAHHSYLSPDGQWVLVVEMDNLGLIGPCLVVPFQGGGPARAVGPPEVSALPAPGPQTVNGFTSRRRRVTSFTSGVRNSLTGSPSNGLQAPPPKKKAWRWLADGKSFITSVGTRNSMAWIHDQRGEQPVSVEGQVGMVAVSDSQDWRANRRSLAFSADGKKLYYLGANGRTSGSELWVKEIATGKAEQVLPSYSMSTFSVSRDGEEVAFAGRMRTAATACGSPPQTIASRRDTSIPRRSKILQPFCPMVTCYFVPSREGLTYLYRMHADGTARRKVSLGKILELFTVSPDGRWAAVQAPDPSGGHPYAVFALPIEGGSPVRLCVNTCYPKWDARGEFMYMDFLGQADPNSYALPIQHGSGLPDLPSTTIAGTEDLKKLKSALVFPHVVDASFQPIHIPLHGSHHPPKPLSHSPAVSQRKQTQRK